MEHLKLSRENSVLTVALNRPEKRNAFFPAMIAEMTKAFRDCAKDRELRAVVLTAEGVSFCAGGDLEWMKSMADYSFKQNQADAEKLFELYWTIRCCPVPVIGRVFGHCFGGGVGLAAVCDIVIAEAATQFCFSEVKWGLAPAVISPFVVERASAAAVREWFLTAKVFLAPEAATGGLVHKFGSMAEVDRAVGETVARITAAGPEAVRATKKLLQNYSPIAWKKMRPAVTRLIAQRRVSAEGQLGLQAFLDKKTPVWSSADGD